MINMESLTTNSAYDSKKDFSTGKSQDGFKYNPINVVQSSHENKNEIFETIHLENVYSED